MNKAAIFRMHLGDGTNLFAMLEHAVQVCVI